MTHLLSVSIVLYKTSIEQLQRCLLSLGYYKKDLFIFLIDNSPTDELRKVFDKDLVQDYIHLPSNPGYGSAHNVAIRKSQSLGFLYHLVLNADIYFDTDVLGPMLAYMDVHSDIALMMPKILNPDGSLQRLCKLVPTPFDLILRRFASKNSRKRNNQHFELHSSGYDKTMFVPYLSGCFMLLRHQALLTIGLFDERYFMYPEDIDLSRRLAIKYQTIFFPEVSVIHEYGSASKKSFHMFLIHLYNLCKYFNKWGWFIDAERDRLNIKTLSQL